MVANVLRTWFRKQLRGRAMPAHTTVKLDKLVEGLGGQWVGIKDGEVVAAARTMDELLMALHESRRPGVRNATIMRVRAEGEQELVGLG